jgi:integrase
MKRILDACDKYGGNQERIKAFVLTMRYTGLRIGDTIRLSKSQVADGKVFVRTAKTGQPVIVPVPPEVVTMLGKIESGSDRYFWTGKNIRSAVLNWSRYLGRVFELATIEDGHSYRFEIRAQWNSSWRALRSRTSRRFSATPHTLSPSTMRRG